MTKIVIYSGLENATVEDTMTNRPRPETERQLHGPLQAFDLEDEVARLVEEKEWREGRRNAITLRKGGGLNVVVLVMRAGDRVEEHSAPGPISLDVRKGRILFTAAENSVEAGRGTLISCDAQVPHAVEALEDAVCLLNVTTG